MITQKQQSTTNVENQVVRNTNNSYSEKNDKVKEYLLYHYTVGHYVKPILESGVLKTTNINLLPWEKPVLWFSKNSKFEYTTLKSMRDPRSGDSIKIDFELQHKLWRNVRFVVNCNPKDHKNEYGIKEWNEINVISNTPSKMKKSLEKYGKMMGGNQNDWCGTLTEIPISNLKFQVWNSDIQEWVDEDIQLWSEKNSNLEYGLDFGIVLEHRKLKNPKGWMNEPIYLEYHNNKN
jgi:hypothetical protein